MEITVPVLPTLLHLGIALTIFPKIDGREFDFFFNGF